MIGDGTVEDKELPPDRQTLRKSILRTLCCVIFGAVEAGPDVAVAKVGTLITWRSDVGPDQLVLAFGSFLEVAARNSSDIFFFF